ncbi:uncharacterized protein LOC111695386 [Eurytemora carolleeae]|uniref:uncharacterized protein LOC111695386 n=1 Tax=Eurytemora carolleeae TaxID=1294199 RepID=UPI000C7621C9|nr:uncharacterized protein LOC111695386 [Eurytemora carolleeae]|eukprot:XP_023320474.1 uncharacterized protein LOC111695386 [Eurytemora affinis]
MLSNVRFVCIIALSISIISTNIQAVPTDVYFMNKYSDLRTESCYSCKDQECVVTQADFKYSSKMTVCFRQFPFVYKYPQALWSVIASIGTLNEDETFFKEGIAYGVWKTGPWLGFKYGDNEEWIGLGTKVYELQTWQHTCFTLNMETGNIQLFENGKKSFDVNWDILVTFWKNVSETFTVASPSCWWREIEEQFMSTYGKVTDMQVFSKILSEDELRNITGCIVSMEGDIVSWKYSNWKLIGAKKTSSVEILDWTNDVCKSANYSIHLIPIKRSNQPWGAHTCSKLSGRQLTYDTKEDFDDIVKYLSSSRFQNSSCSAQDKNGYNTGVWFGTNDEDEEGVWRHFHNKKQITYLNWLPGRPYLGSHEYNCIRLHASYTATNSTYSQVIDARILDSECNGYDMCTACIVDYPVRKLFVRGLCQASIFDREYFYNIDLDGSILYMGTSSSIIIFDKKNLEWLWYDRKVNSSVAFSTSNEDSLLLGVNKFEFSGVNSDPCKKVGESTLKIIKFTTCSQNQFTCDDGQCIDMDESLDVTKLPTVWMSQMKTDARSFSRKKITKE